MKMWERANQKVIRTRLRREVGVFKKYRDSQWRQKYRDSSEQGESIRKQGRQEKQAEPVSHSDHIHICFRKSTSYVRIAVEMLVCSIRG